MLKIPCSSIADSNILREGLPLPPPLCAACWCARSDIVAGGSWPVCLLPIALNLKKRHFTLREQGLFFVGHLFLILGVGVQGLVGGAGGLPEEGADDVRHDRRQGQQLADNDLGMIRIIKAGQQRSHITQKNSLLTMKIAHLKVTAS